MRKKLASYAYMTFAMVLCGSSTVAGKLLCVGLPVFLSQGLSLAFAVPFMFAARALRRPKDSFCRKDIILIILQGLTGTFLFRVFMLFGLKSVSASVSGIILGSTPAVLAVLSVITLAERPKLSVMLGVAITLAAVLCVQQFHGSATIKGVLLVFCSAVCEALMTIFRKKMSPGISPVTNAALVLAAALILFIPFSVYEALKFDWSAFRPQYIAVAAYYGIGASAVAYLCWFKGIEGVEGSKAAVFAGAAPISSVLLSALIGEPLRWVYAASVGLLVFAVYLISRGEKSSDITG